MPLETGSWISDLVETNPVGASDKVKSLDDHDRLIKKVLQNSFPDHKFPQGTLDLGGAADVYTATFVQNAPVAYTKYMRVSGLVAAATTNTGAATINVNALGAKAIKQLGGGDVVAGDLVAGRYVDLIYDGTNFVLAGPYRVLEAPAATLMVFQQTTPPVGWTKETTHNDKAFRVVTGTVSSGGANSFSSKLNTAFASAGYQLIAADIPQLAGTTDNPGNHAHAQNTGTPYWDAVGTKNSPTGADTWKWGGNTGAAGGHTHIVTVNAGGGQVHAHDIAMDLQYVDLIIAKRDA